MRYPSLICIAKKCLWGQKKYISKSFIRSNVRNFKNILVSCRIILHPITFDKKLKFLHKNNYIFGGSE